MFFSSYKLKNRNIHLVFLAELLTGILFFLPILALYLKENVLSTTDVAIIFSITAFANVLFEIPTGAFGDLFGRKRTIIVAHITTLIANIFLFLGSDIMMFSIYAILIALSRSLLSGLVSAFIFDSLKEENKEKHYKKIIGTFHAAWPFGAVIGSLIGGFLATISLSFTILMTFIPLSLALLLSLFLKEPKYEKGENDILKHIKSSIIEVSRNKQILVLIVANLILISFGEATHELKPIFFEFKEIDIQYFGFMFALTFGASSIGHYFSHEVSEKIGNKNTIIFTSILSSFFMILATLSFGLAAGLILILASVPYGIRNPIINHMINLEINSKNRATILSIHKMVQMLALFIVLPFVGLLADTYEINTAFFISSILMLSAIFVLVFLKDKN